jgi:pyridoxal phosphate enzyme (YggS family)
MSIENYIALNNEIKLYGARLVAISKTKPAPDILALYHGGQRMFGENKVQELTQKHDLLPKDIQWHLVGHLQTNKVKYVAPFVSMIQSVDSLKLLQEINKQAEKNNRVIDCLLQMFIADEETKFGLSTAELEELLTSVEYAEMKNIRICGLMGMATNTADETQIDTEFRALKDIYNNIKTTYFADAAYFTELSMGMSSDYKIALKNGATLVRIGSMLFGKRLN